jgi:hypothetical protein
VVIAAYLLLLKARLRATRNLEFSRPEPIVDAQQNLLAGLLTNSES